tara:strand:- start:336 stop:632 length:297 start_codon:yes stop_codon:yes gene_type:complete
MITPKNPSAPLSTQSSSSQEVGSVMSLIETHLTSAKVAANNRNLRLMKTHLSHAKVLAANSGREIPESIILQIQTHCNRGVCKSQGNSLNLAVRSFRT